MSARYVDNGDTLAKFYPDGSTRRHPGSTIVSHVVTESSVMELGRRIQEDLREKDLAQGFGLTPPSSFHMTVLPGVKAGPGTVEDRSTWPEWLRDVNDFPEAVMRMRDALVEADIAGPSEFRMAVHDIYPLQDRLTISVVPADSETSQEVDRFRREAGAAIGIRVPSMDDYAFHVTLGYRLTVPDGDELQRLLALRQTYQEWAKSVDLVDLEDPVYTVFADMNAFATLLTFAAR